MGRSEEDAVRSRDIFGFVVLGVLFAGVACGRSAGGDGAGPEVSVLAAPEVEPLREETPAVVVVVPTEPEPEPEPEIDVDLEEAAPPAPRPRASPTDAPVTSVDPTRPVIGSDENGEAAESVVARAAARSPNIDPSYEGGPMFRDDDPLVRDGIPICVALIRGLEECWPKVDPEIRELTAELVASMLNGARALKRPFVRERACEMGWDSLPGMYGSYCPGAFSAQRPPTIRGE